MMSIVTPVVTEPPAAARAGADLREARERLGLSLHDVAFTLRIRLPHLEALEEGRISLLPGNAYALAFVRTYASTLGLDAEEMVRRFRTEAAEFSRRTELVFPIPMPEPGLPAGAVLLLGLVLAIGAYAGWYRLSGEGRLPAETVAAIPERLAPLAQQALPPIAPPGPAAPGSATLVRPLLIWPRLVRPRRARSHLVQRPRRPVAPCRGSSWLNRRRPTCCPRRHHRSWRSLPPRPPRLSFRPACRCPGGRWFAARTGVRRACLPGPVPPPDASRVVLRATADAWILVKDHSGAVLLNRVLKAGETWPVPPRPDLVLTTGNAGGTDILVDGATTASLGGPGTVRRDMQLDPDQIKDGKLAGAAVPQLASSRPRQ